MRHIELLDSTLRDGLQAEGVAFTLNDKLAALRVLDALGLPYIEAGNPASNPKELAFFAQAVQLPLQHAKLCAFGATCRKHTEPQDDANCQALLQAGTPCVVLFGKSHPLHVQEILQTTPNENLRMIESSLRFFAAAGRETLFDAEHFFDGYAQDPAYALATLQAAARGGARVLVLCDTNGGQLPWQITEIVSAVRAALPHAVLGVHTHNDGGMAEANACAAVQAGASHVQGTLLGFGERVGNANLCTVAPNLQLKMHCTCLPPQQLQQLCGAARALAELANLPLRSNQPFVGGSAFAHKAGMHADGVLKNPASFEHIHPSLVGNHRRVLMSEVTGKAAVLARVQTIYPNQPVASQTLQAIVAALKAREFEGYSFESADASFDLLIREHIEAPAPFFELISYKVLDQLPYDNNHSATATLKLRVQGQTKIAAAEGDGPVNALDLALREALAPFFPKLQQIELLDYKVRIMESAIGTGTSVRVCITSGNSHTQWTTVGVSQDIIEASWEALVSSVAFALWRAAPTNPPPPLT